MTHRDSAALLDVYLRPLAVVLVFAGELLPLKLVQHFSHTCHGHDQGTQSSVHHEFRCSMGAGIMGTEPDQGQVGHATFSLQGAV